MADRILADTRSRTRLLLLGFAGALSWTEPMNRHDNRGSRSRYESAPLNRLGASWVLVLLSLVGPKNKPANGRKRPDAEQCSVSKKPGWLTKRDSTRSDSRTNNLKR